MSQEIKASAGLSRRNFIKIMTAGAVAIPGAVEGYIFLTSTPKIPNNLPSSETGYSITAGGIESVLQNPFIEKNMGPLYFALEAAQRHDLIKKTLTDTLNHLNQKLKQGKRDGLGDLTAFPIKFASDHLSQIPIDQIDPKTNLSWEAVHIASFADFLATSAWLNKDEYRQFGITKDDLADGESVGDYYWGKSGISSILPKIYSAPGYDKPGAEFKFDGSSRFRHRSAHFFCTNEFLYSQTYGLEDVLKGIPRILSLTLALENLHSPINDPDEDSVRFSDTLGVFYKLSEMDRQTSWPFGNQISSGIFDSMNPARYAANRLGADTAVALRQFIFSQKSIIPIIKRLNDPAFGIYRPDLGTQVGLDIKPSPDNESAADFKTFKASLDRYCEPLLNYGA